ncbi:Helix-turn-helix domain-containing protein [Flaviramulus basaltis]|uniref:Helix-turn-helix domain-containing protein n=1 Tax=Flaviramulus basaltis TaxID=369401 RepID=A0A1K2IEY7_9FLAO|nr:response regulator transcription factor [Flaviramulus basaltis]SFZ90988.1 Helix-turn-helix domain-containing protein [Flaviramulus basaltis]
MKNKTIHKINSISEFHKLRNLPKPEHPLISLIDYTAIIHTPENDRISWLQTYYSIALKKDVPGKYRYGQQDYDFDDGLMSFFAPNQILNIEYVEKDITKEPSGWILLIHPDFLWNTPLAKTIKHYAFFNYSLTEALFLSEKEELTIANILKNIKQEYQSNIDKFSQSIILSQVELLLNYAERYYERQFITRNISNHEILSRLDEALNQYFNDENSNQGLPSVEFIADALNLSSNYLSSSLKSITGQSTQQHIHEKLITKAKEKLSTTELSVGEIAYALGFEHPQSFSKLFKTKTNLSPSEFRQSFN